LLSAGRLADADALLTDAAAEEPPSLAGPIEELRAGIESARGNHERAEHHAAAALGLAERASDREAALRAWLRLHEAAVALDQRERAQLYAERAASLARRGAPQSLQDAAQQALSLTPPEPVE
jgi:hypothetical protein